MSKTGRTDWRGVANQLAASLPAAWLDPAVLRWIASRSPRTAWSVAFSGGPDSLALLLLLWAHWPKRRRFLRALHFDHRLRGAESRADAAFCAKVCAALGVPLVRGSWRGEHRGASEAEARSARMGFLAQHGRVVFFGHQQDDIAETMLMRIARGSGSGGLGAPRPVQAMPQGRVHLRPLLALKKREIIAALRRAGANWREDSSNGGGAYLRNRIRHRVIAGWAMASERDALAGAARSRLLLEEDDAALEGWVDAVAPLDRRGRLALAALAGKPRAFVRRALHRWLQAEPRCGEISRQAFDALLEAVESGRPTRHSVGREGFAMIDRKYLRFESAGKRPRSFRGRAN